MGIVRDLKTIFPPAKSQDPHLEVYVVFTTPERTRTALQVANELARGLGARLTLLVAQTVPYPLPLDRPAVRADFTERALSQLAGGQDVDTRVNVYLCRDRDQTVRRELAADSIVLIGTRARWLRHAERKLAGLLRRDGHHVILVETNKLQPIGPAMARMQSSC